jgi:asparagine synthase (glutamine-hydrolysing)
MTDVMTHRGPNDRGTLVRDGVALGVRRLSIVDVAGGHQPMANEDETIWAIQNGELYNHEHLRRQLADAGHTFHTSCDTEVLPHLYERFGVEFPAQLFGMWGAVVWDAARRRCVITRDRLGIKPLYYAVRDDLVVFASELKSLLASGLVAPELDLDAIDSYLHFGFIPAPRTPLLGVSKLLPAHSLVIEDGRVRTERYWSYPEPAPETSLGLDEAAAGLIERLDDSVRLRLMSDVPLGAMLSGGLDSSVIVALMARNMGEPVKTFSVGFRDDASGNELGDARLVAQTFGTDHHELELSFDEAAIDLAELVWHLDEPLADVSSVGFLAISKLAAEHVTVALSGQGADELLGGYTKHRAAALVGRWRRMPTLLRVAGDAVARRAPARFARAGATLVAPGPAERVLAMSGRLSDGLRSRLYTGQLAARGGSEAIRALRDRAGSVTDDDPLAATLFIDGQFALPDDMLHYFDRTSMAYSLEVRVPFLDHRVVEYCARIPSRFKVSGKLETKHVLKHAARSFLPAEIVDKRKLGFFRSAADEWLRAQLRGDAANYLLGSDPRFAELLDRATVRELAAQHRDGSADHDVHLLVAILILEVWLSTYLPRALAGS